MIYIVMESTISRWICCDWRVGRRRGCFQNTGGGGFGGGDRQRRGWPWLMMMDVREVRCHKDQLMTDVGVKVLGGGVRVQIVRK